MPVTLPKFESERAWGFAYAVLRYAKEQWCAQGKYVWAAEVARLFGVPRIQADLALRLLCATAEMGRRNDGRYYVLNDADRRAKQEVLSQARVSL